MGVLRVAAAPNESWPRKSWAGEAAVYTLLAERGCSGWTCNAPTTCCAATHECQLTVLSSYALEAKLHTSKWVLLMVEGE
jgi:hypothetical protein